jgi:beta-lactamase regulating signal transducer with metallopeptidase domain
MRALVLMSLTGGVVSVLLFALKPFIRSRLSKTAQYCLWITAVFVFLIPISAFIKMPALTQTAPSIISPNSMVERYVITSDEEMTNINRVVRLQPEVDAGRYEQLMKETISPIAGAVGLFAAMYPFGVFAVLLYYIINYFVFVRLHRRRNIAANKEELAMLSELCEYNLFFVPKLYRNPLAATPMLIGVFRPMLILPDREYTAKQLRAVMLHELTHLRRGDVLIKWLCVLVSAVHWFNPIVWLVRREIDRACELSCDEAVIRNLDADGKQNYGDTLIYVADRKSVV